MRLDQLPWGTALRKRCVRNCPPPRVCTRALNALVLVLPKVSARSELELGEKLLDGHRRKLGAREKCAPPLCLLDGLVQPESAGVLPSLRPGLVGVGREEEVFGVRRLRGELAGCPRLTPRALSAPSRSRRARVSAPRHPRGRTRPSSSPSALTNSPNRRSTGANFFASKILTVWAHVSPLEIGPRDAKVID